MSERQALAPGRYGAPGLRRRWAGAATVSPAVEETVLQAWQHRNLYQAFYNLG